MTRADRTRRLVLVAHHLGEWIDDQRRELKATEILAVVCYVYAVPPRRVMSPSKESRLVEARHVAWWLIRTHLGARLTRMAVTFGCDHSTIVHALRSVENAMREAISAA